MKAKLRLVLSITIFFSWFYGFSQKEYWKPLLSASQSASHTSSKNHQLLKLEFQAFNLALLGSIEDESAPVFLPKVTGGFDAFYIAETPVLHPELCKKYPRIKSFTGWNKGRSVKARFSFSHNGLQVMLVDLATGKTSFIEKQSHTGDVYQVFRQRTSISKVGFECKTEALGNANPSKVSQNLIDDQTLRKFRIAVSATGEYTDHHGGTVVDALAAINATLTRVNEVFETDLGVTLELIPNNDLLIFTDEETDPYGSNLNAEVQSTLTSIIGEANYDVGHLFHDDNDNGNAGFIGSVCFDNRKGSAFSSALEPEGDLFDLDYVAHELGHQFGANHTWSFESEGTGVQAEPASGTTIMGYAGIVEGNNVAPNGDDYFHYNSIEQISDYLQTVSCAQTSALLNTPPVLIPLGDFTIPKGTAFVLTGNASDADNGDILTYNWEQIDDGVVTRDTFGPDNATGANFRSLTPTTNPSRYFPRLSRVVSGQLVETEPEVNGTWETVSTIERELNFALTVRDNATGGGQVVSDFVKVNVSNNSGPFVVTSQTTNTIYEAGSIQEITWDVANTNTAPINAAAVDIYLSTNGGETFPFLIADNVPNTGFAKVQLPGEASNTARLMVKASDNIFFAVNASDFTIEASDFVLNFNALTYAICKPDALTIPFIFETYNGFMGTVSFSANLPDGLSATFLPSMASVNETNVDLSISDTSNLTVGSYPIEVIATSSSGSVSTILELNVYDADFEELALVSPSNEAVGTSVNPEFLWTGDANATNYDIEIATDASFAAIIESANTIFNSYQSSNLISETTYYWRVRPNNQCGEGAFGQTATFTTAVVTCKVVDSNGLPLEISAEDPSTITSTLSFAEDLKVFDMKVNLELSHTYLEDLIVSLTSPSGTTVTLISKTCGSSNNLNAVFDDNGVPISCSGNPAIQGTITPLGSLASFQGESILGDWILTIEDTAASDGGALDAFSLEVCVEGVFRPDADEDGVFDDGDDLCLGTPKGVTVDTSGCALNDLPANSYTLEIQSESCRQSNDGAIIIDAVDTAITYSATLVGNGLDSSMDFTGSNSFEGLMAGQYQLCLSGTDGVLDYRENCFELIITEPEVLMVTSTLLAGSNQVLLQMAGADLYTIDLDGIVIQTDDSELLVDLKEGHNNLKVYSSLPCQGTYEERLFVGGEIMVYPNPMMDYISIETNKNESRIAFELFTISGQLVINEVHESVNNGFDIDVSSLSKGIYIAVVNLNGESQTFKLIKR